MKCPSSVLFLLALAMVFSLPVLALTGADVSPVTALETVSPTVQSATALTERSLSVSFSEPLLSPGATTPGNYAVSGAGRGTLAPSPDGVTGSGPNTLTWTGGEMRDGAAVTVTVSGVQDAVGNPLLPASATASAAGIGTVPVFTALSVTPSSASVGDTVTVTFTASEPLDGDPAVTVNGHPAVWVSGAKAVDFTYTYEVAEEDAPGMAAVSVSGVDLAGNMGSLESLTALEINEAEAGLPVRAWPLALLLLGAGAVLFLRARRRGVSGGRAFLLIALFVLPALLCATAFAAPPAVSNVSMVQQDNGAGGTEAVITYDLDAPNGPCDITVSLSKDGGVDGYVFPATSVTGDVSGVAGGAGKQIVWDLRADYPEEALANARIRVTADDGLVQHTLTYTAGANGTITGDSPQTVNHGADGTAVTAVPDVNYHFTQWSDGVLTAARTDTNVMGDITVTASFVVPPPVVTAFAVTGGAATTMPLGVTLDNTATESPVEYMASESAAFTGAVWQTYGTAPAFTLSFGVGTRTVYFKVRTAALVESGVVSDTIFLVPNTVPVAAGTFSMGRTSAGDDATYGGTAELPVHSVTLGAYTLGKFEVTNKEYCDVLNWALAQGYLYSDTTGTPWSGSGDIYAGGAGFRFLIVSFTSTECNIEYTGGVFTSKTRVGLPGTTNYSMDTHPMVRVSWYGSVAYCNWLSQMQGLTPCYDMTTATWPLTVAPPTAGGYRLPTEAEWERAAAWDGVKHWIYGFLSDTNATGTANRCNDNNSYDTSDNPLGLTTVPYTSPVGWFNGVNVNPNGGVTTENSPSPVGAYDMSGNVWEWCGDWYLNTYYGVSPASNPTGPATGTSRVLRGGSWSFSFDSCRSALRSGNPPGNTISSARGFRVSRNPLVPEVTSFAITSGAATTTNPVVTLDNTAANSPTEYMASEAGDFSGASWQAYGTAPSFSLSAGTGGVKTVYFKVRTAELVESAVVSDTIDLVERTILLPGSVPLVLRWVPSGSYQMGRYAGEVDSYTNEDPQHLVTLAYGFWMGKYEVTQQQWIAVRSTWPGLAPSANFGLGNTYPAYWVSWNDTKNFITSLNTHIAGSGQGPLTVRLPSESEWEYACRGGTQTRFYWGDDIGYTQIGTYAWYSGNNTPSGSKAVGGKTGNAFGLFDMSGNVWEWCEDDYHANYTGAPADGSAWIDSPRAAARVTRGGSWGYAPWICRSAYRNNVAAGGRGTDTGFRLAAVQ